LSQNAETCIALGLQQHQTGQIGLAQSHYQRAVKLDPKNAKAWHLLGICAFQQNLVAKAIKNYQQALSLQPGQAEAWNNLGIAQKASQQLDAALQSFTQALSIRAEYTEAAFNLALLYEARGDFEQAQLSYKRVLQWQPHAINSLSNLGNLLRKLARYRESAEHLEKADQLERSASTQLNLALLALDQSQYAKAQRHAEAALQLEPDSLDIKAALATALRLQHDYSNALIHLRALHTLQPKSVETLMELALTEQACGDYTEALRQLALARKLSPQSERLRWIEAFLLPLFVVDASMRTAALGRFAEKLGEFEARSDWSKVAPVHLLEAVMSVSAFDLSYLAADTLSLHQRFCALVEARVQALLPQLPVGQLRVSEAETKSVQSTPEKLRKRIGVISSYLREHTVMRFFAGLIESINKDTYELVMISTSGISDSMTERLRKSASVWIDAPWPVLDVIASLRALDLDLLIFTDVGMDSQQHVIAAAKTAPLQACLYGHPISAGLKSIDYYFSGEALEPVGAKAHYTENLITLPKLGACVVKPDVEVQSMRQTMHVKTLLCTQSIAKLNPEFDRAIARIAELLSAKQLKASLSFFDRQPELSARFLARLRSAIAPSHAQFLQITLLPSCGYGSFMEHLGDADVVLDSPWFSGGATSIDTLSVATPIVTWEAPFARGRQTAGMLRMLECEALVCQDTESFAQTVLRVLDDGAFDADIRRRLRTNAHRLFDVADVNAIFAEHIAKLLGAKTAQHQPGNTVN
jgi:protein O-GlcNAc transferase